MNKVLMGLMSIIPMIIFVIYIMALIAGSESMVLIGGLFCLLGLITLIDTIWFIVYTCKQPQWPTEKKVIWGIVLYSFNFLVFPIFWWLYVRVD